MLKYLLLIFISTSIFSQEDIDLKIEIAKNNGIYGKSEGDTSIKYLNYELYDILSELTKIPIEDFVISNSTDKRNPKINLTAKSDKIINKRDLVTEILKTLRDEYDIIINIKKETRKVDFFTIDYTNFRKCKSSQEEGSLGLSNNVLIGRCISFNQLKDIINKWYKKVIYVKSKDKKTNFNIEIKKIDSWKIFKVELAHKLGIDIIKSNKEISILYIN